MDPFSINFHAPFLSWRCQKNWKILFLPYVTNRNVSVFPTSVLRDDSWSYPPRSNFCLLHAITPNLRKNILTNTERKSLESEEKLLVYKKDESQRIKLEVSLYYRVLQ